MAIKIQINSLEALERLIGGDSELELELRNSVVQDFASKHLKSLAVTFSNRSLSQEFATEVRKQIADIGTFDKWNSTCQLNPKVKAEIENTVKQTVKELINELIDKNTIQSLAEQMYKKHLKSIDANLEILMTRQINAKLQSLTIDLLSSKKEV